MHTSCLLELQAFLAKAKQEEKEEEVRKLHQMSLKKQENQALLEKHRQTRIQVTLLEIKSSYQIDLIMKA